MKRKEVGIDEENPEGSIFEVVKEIPSEPDVINKMMNGKRKKKAAFWDGNNSLEDMLEKLLANNADKLTEELRNRDKKLPVDMGFVGKVASMSQDNPQFKVFHYSPRTQLESDIFLKFSLIKKLAEVEEKNKSPLKFI